MIEAISYYIVTRTYERIFILITNTFVKYLFIVNDYKFVILTYIFHIR